MSHITDFEVLIGTFGAYSLAEGPWWSVSAQRLYWVDIPGMAVYSSDLKSEPELVFTTPSEVGFVIPCSNGSLIAGLRDGLYVYDPMSESLKRLTTAAFEPASHRINDGKTDRSGRVWYGTIDDTESHNDGYLYSYAHGTESVIRQGVTTSNGIGWSPDDMTMYFTDSMDYAIYAYDYDLRSGTASRPRVFARDTGVGRPDGLTVDASGCVWSAKFEGSEIVRYAPDGRIVSRISTPIARPTSCAFCGPNLNLLAVTSARLDEADNQDSSAGSIFLLETDVSGIAETPFSLF